MISDSEEITGKIVNILAYQAVITAQGENYTGEKDWALNKLRDLFKEELQKAVQEEKPKHCCCLLEDSKVVERCKLHGDELQKARESERERIIYITKNIKDAFMSPLTERRWLQCIQFTDQPKPEDQSELDQGPDAFERQGL